MKISCLQTTSQHTFATALDDLNSQLETLCVREQPNLILVGAYALPGPIVATQWKEVERVLSALTQRTGATILLGALAGQDARLVAHRWDSNGNYDALLLDRGNCRDDPFVSISLHGCQLALVHPDELWIPEVPRCAALAGVDGIVALGATRSPAQAQRTELMWGMAALVCTPLLFVSPCSTDGTFHGASAFAWPNCFQFRMTDAPGSESVELSKEVIATLREPDLRFKNSLWYCLWGRRPELYPALTASGVAS